MNQGESHDLALALMSLGHQRIDDERDADIVLINTCVVIKPTETKIMRRLRQLNQTGKSMVIAGCIPAVASDALSMEFPGAIRITPSEYGDFKELARSRFGEGDSSLLTIPGPSAIGVLPISQGCLGNCSYCLTKKARGDLSSYPKEMIIGKLRSLLERGAKEVQVTAQDTGCYGLDIRVRPGGLVIHHPVCRRRLHGASGDDEPR